MQIISDLFTYIAIVVVGLLPIANPFSTAPVFLAVTTKLSNESKYKLLKLTCIYMFSILIIFLLAGALILSFFGISVSALRIAGGLIITVLGFRMLFPSNSSEKERAPVTTYEQAKGLAFTPLAMPMLSGPGSIAVIISMAAQISEQESFVLRLGGYAVVGLGILITVTICWLVLRSSTRITKLLGPTGIDALTRIMGFILICIGVEFTASGIKGFF
ncbi:MAG: MarC family NAAT transporter [Thermodesulfobacteriota bacterium]